MDALAERLHLQHDLCPDAAHLAGRRCTFRQHHSLCALSASRAKLLCPPTRLSDRAQCMARLRGMLPVSKGLNASLTSVLRLAAVSPWRIPLAVCRLRMAQDALKAFLIPIVAKGFGGCPPLPSAGIVCMYALPSSLQPAPSCCPSEALSTGMRQYLQNDVVTGPSMSSGAARGQGVSPLQHHSLHSRALQHRSRGCCGPGRRIGRPQPHHCVSCLASRAWRGLHRCPAAPHKQPQLSVRERTAGGVPVQCWRHACSCNLEAAQAALAQRRRAQSRTTAVAATVACKGMQQARTGCLCAESFLWSPRVRAWSPGSSWSGCWSLWKLHLCTAALRSVHSMLTALAAGLSAGQGRRWACQILR